MFRLYARVLGLLGPRRGSAGCWRSPMSRWPRRSSPSRCCSAASSTRWPARRRSRRARLAELTPLLGAWVGFGLFTIVCGALAALYADRLAHRRRQAVLTDYFEHVLQLPLSYHGGTHSGRLLKVMLTGTDSLWWLWLGFFREHLAAFVSLARAAAARRSISTGGSALLLIGLCVIFAALTAFVMRKTEALQSSVERHYSDLAERTSDALGNVALVQSFTRVEAEVRRCARSSTRLLGAQMPVLSWWAMVAVLTRASTTLTMLAIFVARHLLYRARPATIGEIVTFMNFAGMLIAAARAGGRLRQPGVDGRAAAARSSSRCSTPSRRCATGRTPSTRAACAARSSSTTSPSPMTASAPAVADLTFKAQPGETIALVGADRRGQVDGAGAAAPRLRSAVGRDQIDGTRHPRRQARGAAAQHRRRLPGGAAVQPLDRREPARRQARRDRSGDARGRARAPRRSTSSSASRTGSNATVGERGRLALRRRAPAPVDRARAAEGPADPDSRRGHQRARCRDRGQGAGGARRGDERPHHLRHRAPARHRPQRDRILVFDRGRIVETGTFDELVAKRGVFAKLAEAQFLAPAAS